MADFGWSNLKDDIRKTYCGTPEYFSPEMILGTSQDTKLDIWSVGVLMYELLYGYSPFKASSKIDNRRLK